MAEIGPRALYRVLHESYENRRDFVGENVSISTGYFSENIMWWREPWELISPADKYEENEEDLEAYLATLPPDERPNLSYVRLYYGEGPVDSLFDDDWFEMPGFGDKQGWEWCSALWDDQRLLDWNAPLPLYDW